MDQAVLGQMRRTGSAAAFQDSHDSHSLLHLVIHLILFVLKESCFF